MSILGLLPEARGQDLIPTLTTYQTNWTEIGKRLGDAAFSEIAKTSAEGDLQDPKASKVQHQRVQLKMAVEFSPGESVHSIGAVG